MIYIYIGFSCFCVCLMYKFYIFSLGAIYSGICCTSTQSFKFKFSCSVGVWVVYICIYILSNVVYTQSVPTIHILFVLFLCWFVLNCLFKGYLLLFCFSQCTYFWFYNYFNIDTKYVFSLVNYIVYLYIVYVYMYICILVYYSLCYA